MDSIALNFVPLLEQDNCVTVYRTRVFDSSQPKRDEDFRASLPAHDGDEEWVQFDVSTSARDGFEEYEYEYSRNPFLTVNLIYHEFLETLKVQTAELEYYVPEKAIALKEIRFITEKFYEGNAEIIVKPYYLKGKKGIWPSY